jgi:epsilon-lactone hydrolase
MRLPRRAIIGGSVACYRIALNHRVSARAGRRILDATAPAMRVPSGTVIRHEALGGRPAERTTVGATERADAILYLHGGGYTVGSPRLYRGCAAYLAKSAQAVVYNLDYRLAPEHPYPAALDDAVAAFRELVHKHGHDPSRVAIAGDSAGGGLAVAAARVLVDEGLRPAALGLLSPWTDPGDEQFERNRDRVTNVRWGRASATLYRGSAEQSDPGYAPMHGSLDGLPPMLIHCSTVEMLYPQIERFAVKAKASDVAVEFVARQDWWHSIHVLAGALAEATDAVTDVGTYLHRALTANATNSANSAAPTR